MPDRIGEGGLAKEEEGRRVYVTGQFRRRLHQQAFRERVLKAYQEQCALCRLRHSELLDVAHIIPDGEPGGDPVVRNGLALCKLYHAAFDPPSPRLRRAGPLNRTIGVVEVREDLLEEHDGPMLEHGLQKLQGTRIIIPRRPLDRPDPDHLRQRFERFRAA
jgi:putative restriction endonuclease